ncbi:MAG: immunoglobulin domain-containing protein, partial [Silvibacterium sp.]|nr:immunoglobulin domain-containing protein [Silvibacterium sp.]
FDGDGKLDLAVGNSSDNTVSILLGKGDGTFTAATGSPVGVGKGPQSVAVGDFNGDGRLDIASANSSSVNVSVLVQVPFALSPNNGLSFGNQNVGSSSSTQSVTLTAVLAMDITSIEVSAGSANFQLVTTASSCPYSGGTLGAGANCTVDLQFAPTAVGRLTGTVTVTVNSGGGTTGAMQSIGLSGMGTGTAPFITSQPVRQQTVIAGQMVTFTAAATGFPTPTVQWQVSVNGGPLFTNINGATSTTLSFTTTAAMNGNVYRAVFTNSLGSTTTNPATLGVDTAPSITSNPTNQAVPAGQTATFTAAATGNPAPTVQWQVNTGSGFTNIPGATSTTLIVANVTDSMTGYQYRAMFTNVVSSVPTSAATLTVEDYIITATPPSQTIPAGHSATYTINLTSVRGLTGNVALTCSGGPPNSKCTINPSTKALNGTATVAITLMPPMNVNLGTFTLTFTGSLDGIMHSANVTLTVK